MTFLDVFAAAQDGPKPEDVVAGWLGFAVFVGLCAAVALLGWSLSRQLKKADRARKAGVFGDEPDEDESDAEADSDSDDPASGA